MEDFLHRLSGYLWAGVPLGDSGLIIPLLLGLLLGIGIYLTLGLRFLTWRKLFHAFRLLFSRDETLKAGEISSFQALMTALSATVGTGNIAGVATAIVLGGPGAIFWMWITALFGMATKYAEALLAVRYREVDSKGHYVGGPMYYIKNGLAGHWHWLATAFALFGAIAGLGIGNMVQANSVAHAVDSAFQLPPALTGAVLAVLVAFVIIGGIKRIAAIATGLVPLMTFSYIACAMIVIAMHWHQILPTLGLIIDSAFTGTAASGGFVGASVWAAIRFGVARGVFSNEAGLGSAPIAHAAAKTDDPVRQGLIAMLGTFIDTIIICTMTALVILLTGVWTNGENGAALSNAAFVDGLGDFGATVVTIGLVLFAFTTLLGWSYYGERCAQYVFGIRIVLPYRILWVLVIPLGAMGKLETVWLLADVMNGLMAIPNLIALALLSSIVFHMTKLHFGKRAG